MVTATTVEERSVYSFSRVKNDMRTVARWVAWNKREHEQLKKQIERLEQRLSKLNARKFVASKKSNKVHSLNCVHAKRIKQPNRTYFDILRDARVKGFEACACT